MISAKRVFDHPDQLPQNLLLSCRSMPLPNTVLMCRPDSFDVVDVKNPHMQGKIGTVDSVKAKEQWKALCEVFVSIGVSVELIEPVPGCEDMVFCANQTLVGLDGNGDKLCIKSNMKHPSRQKEVGAFAQWFAGRDFRIKNIPQNIGFEGSGDAIWHPGRALIWGGSGYRTDDEAYSYISEYFDAPVIVLPLQSERFYHLDTCFCAIDEDTVLIHPASFTSDGVSMIRSVFKNVIECDDFEAGHGMACNACSIGGRHIVIQQGNSKVVSILHNLGYEIYEVDTCEFLKSGGSVFCMKMYVF